MIIKTSEHNILLDSESIQRLTSITTDKYVILNKDLTGFSIEDINERIVNESWVEEEFDGRKLRKIKKDIITQFGDMLLEEYKMSNGIFNTLKKKFINVSEISDILRNTIANEMNTVVYGFGGFGKSEMVSELFARPELRDRVFIKSLSEATTEDDLFGGINLKKMQDTGIIEYIPENSFANKEIAIFEEGFDANPRVLAALKDTLTSKAIRNGNQIFPLKTKVIIILTNKSLDEVILDNSTEALIQRFPISYELQYKLTKLDIAALILNKYRSFDKEKLTAIVDTMHKMPKISPRKILEMAKYLNNFRIIKNRKYNEKITNTDISGVIDYLKHKKSIELESILFDEFCKIKTEIATQELFDYDALRNYEHKVEILRPMLEENKLHAVAANAIRVISEINDLLVMNKLTIAA